MQSVAARDHALFHCTPVNLDLSRENVRGSSVHFRDCFPDLPHIHLQVDPSAVYLHVVPGSVAAFKARLTRPGAAPAPVEGAEPYQADWRKLGQPDAFRHGLRLSEEVRSAPESVRLVALANAALSVLRAADALA